MLYYPFDPLYLYLVLPAFLLSLIAQVMVSSRFKKYSKQRVRSGITGSDAARHVLRNAGVPQMQIQRVAGNLSDHYDPRSNVIRLSQGVCDANTVAAAGVAAHEAGHAIQYAEGYGPMKLRAAIIPITNIGSQLSIPLILIGLLFNMTGLINIGILLFGAVVLFQLVTLPVEFNASRRAIAALSHSGALTPEELPGAKKVLTAAAMTYVAALAVSLAQLVRFIALSNRRR